MTAGIEGESPAQEARASEGHEANEVLGEELSVSGPWLPPTPEDANRDLQVLRFDRIAVPGVAYVVGLHGGAGATTVRNLLRSTPDALTIEESEIPCEIPVGEEPTPALLVARLSGIGLLRAVYAARDWSIDGNATVDLLGLVLVGDSQRIAPPLLPLARRVSRMYPRTWVLPFNATWHLSSEADPALANRRARKTAQQVAHWITESSNTNTKEQD